MTMEQNVQDNDESVVKQSLNLADNTIEGAGDEIGEVRVTEAVTLPTPAESSQAVSGSLQPEKRNSHGKRLFKEEWPTLALEDSELMCLARFNLSEYLHEDVFGFVSGCCSGSRHRKTWERFIEITNLLNEDAKWEIIDAVEKELREKCGDVWEAYKYQFKPGFFSGTADFQAIRLLARKVLDHDWDEIADFYSDAYASVVNEAVDVERLERMPEALR